ncbi:aquaporin-like protein [Fimicolochytrium jonesii]|uniref:aquaporin-like protein n=1 Tax=Fimicolochytrium jonesii TaxID=1396493 RepID=UPI0022FEAA80|nr:aquaporin-like protein [Fimicolochytrium jonesii]KAI8826110.1 aquaporin-like protein [Fimicolochytrium jonesii]
MSLESQISKDTVVDVAEHDVINHVKLSPLVRLRRQMREELAEFFGTFILIIFGNGVCAQTSLHKNTGEYLSINFGWAIGVLMGIYVSAGISGAHLNPAVTIANAVHSNFPWRKVPRYCAAQVLGAFMGAAIVFANYHSALDAFDGGVRQTTGDLKTAGIFATYPQAYLTTVGAFFSEFITTAVLMIGLFAIGESRHADRPKSHSAIAVALLILGLGICLGAPTGYAINPARDFGPRLLTLVAGWGTDPFTVSNYYFWIPIVGPITGGIFGGFVYQAFTEYDNAPILWTKSSVRRLLPNARICTHNMYAVYIR